MSQVKFIMVPQKKCFKLIFLRDKNTFKCKRHNLTKISRNSNVFPLFFLLHFLSFHEWTFWSSCFESFVRFIRKVVNSPLICYWEYLSSDNVQTQKYLDFIIVSFINEWDCKLLKDSKHKSLLSRHLEYNYCK